MSFVYIVASLLLVGYNALVTGSDALVTSSFLFRSLLVALPSLLRLPFLKVLCHRAARPRTSCPNLLPLSSGQVYVFAIRLEAIAIWFLL